MRRLFLFAAIFVLASCSDQSGERADTAESPSISPTSAPGVAFSYFYDFALSDDRISAVQEQHAARCESLGVTRCRVTGLRYGVGQDDAVSAMLEVKLEPSIARQFGKDATEVVQKSDGRMIRTEFSGEDVGSAIGEAGSRNADIRTRIADVQRRIAEARPGSDERAELQRQLSTLQDQVGEQATVIRSGQERLASTPMTFNYYGGGGVPGFGNENPIKEAYRLMVGSFVTMISFTLKLLGVLIPWLLLLAILLLLWRSRPVRNVRNWWARRNREPEGEGESAS